MIISLCVWLRSNGSGLCPYCLLAWRQQEQQANGKDAVKASLKEVELLYAGALDRYLREARAKALQQARCGP